MAPTSISTRSWSPAARSPGRDGCVTLVVESRLGSVYGLGRLEVYICWLADSWGPTSRCMS